MRVPMSVLKLVVGVPTVLASVLLWVVAFALLPGIVGLLAFVMGVGILGLLTVGVGERAAVRLLAASRRAAIP